jgi:hypothetical protein
MQQSRLDRETDKLRRAGWLLGRLALLLAPSLLGCASTHRGAAHPGVAPQLDPVSIPCAQDNAPKPLTAYEARYAD